MAEKKSLELALVSDVRIGQEICWNARSTKNPGLVHRIVSLDDGYLKISTSRGDRTLHPDESIVVVRSVSA